jgi:hypothetical protein
MFCSVGFTDALHAQSVPDLQNHLNLTAKRFCSTVRAFPNPERSKGWAKGASPKLGTLLLGDVGFYLYLKLYIQRSTFVLTPAFSCCRKPEQSRRLYAVSCKALLGQGLTPIRSMMVPSRPRPPSAVGTPLGPSFAIPSADHTGSSVGDHAASPLNNTVRLVPNSCCRPADQRRNGSLVL